MASLIRSRWFRALLPLISVLASGGYLLWQLHRARLADHWVSRALLVQRQALRVSTLLSQMESGQRGEIITSKPSFQVLYDRAIAEMVPALAELRRLTPQEGGEHARLARLVADYRFWVRNSTLEMRLAAHHDPRFLTYFAQGKGASAMERMRRELEGLVGDESKQLVARRVLLERSMRLVDAVALGWILLVLATMHLLAESRRRHVIEQQALARSLERQRAFLELLLSNIAIGILAYDGQGQLTFLNAAARQLLGVQDDHADTVWVDEDGKSLPAEASPLLRARAGKEVHDECHWLLGGPRGRRALIINAVHWHDPGGDGPEVIVTLQDVTDRRAAEDGIKSLVFKDSLTGLHNRRSFQAHLEQALAQARREALIFAVVFLDLDHFKQVNDTFGHEGGDALLAGVAERLAACMRGGDLLFRLGGG